MRASKVTKEYFFNKVYPEPNTGCWIWGGTTGKAGYGVCVLTLKDGYKILNAHRVSYYFHYGQFNKSLFVCHKCDNKWCVNPDHLFLGTHQDNLLDAFKKGRHQRGSRHGHAKLSDNKVIEIRSKYKSGGHTYYSLAKEYGVDHSSIYAVVKGKMWKHVI